MGKVESGTITYKQAGVDIDAGDEMVDRIRPFVERTHNSRVLGGIGGFAGLCLLDYEETLLRRNYRQPVLAACTDGVGTKLKVAFAMNRFDTVGIDLVAMSVNDLVCCGAEPLFFLDYLAVHRLDPAQAADVVKGMTTALLQCEGCALLGGETAEMPGFYAPGELDLAGFAVGVVERDRIIDGAGVRTGDVAIALASDGLHSNGFGLARRALLERGGYKLDDRPPELEGQSVGEAMLTPTRLYVRPVLSVLRRYRVKKVVRAISHITGSGLGGNLPRVLPEGLTVRVKRDSWYVPPIFKLIAAAGPVDPIEMGRVFNMGIGLVMVVAPAFAGTIMSHLRRMGERCWILGKVRKGGPELLWA